MIKIVCYEHQKITTEISMFYKIILAQKHTLNKRGYADNHPAHYWMSQILASAPKIWEKIYY